MGNPRKHANYYLIFGLLFSLVSAIIFIISKLKPSYVDHTTWWAQFFFLFVWGGSHLISEKGLQRQSEFHIFYMASMCIRFLLSIIFIFLIIFYADQSPVIFIVAFFILYLVYTSFEIYFLLRKLRTDFKTDGTNNKTT